MAFYLSAAVVTSALSLLTSSAAAHDDVTRGSPSTATSTVKPASAESRLNLLHGAASLGGRCPPQANHMLDSQVRQVSPDQGCQRDWPNSPIIAIIAMNR